MTRAQKIVGVLFGLHPLVIAITTGYTWNALSTEDALRSVIQCVGWCFVTIIAIGIAGIFSWGTKQVKQQVTAGQQRYEQLPELGKIRVDRNNAQVAKYGGVAAVGLFSLIVAAVNPYAWGGIIVAGRAAIRNWRDQDETIHELDAKRNKAIGS